MRSLSISAVTGLAALGLLVGSIGCEKDPKKDEAEQQAEAKPPMEEETEQAEQKEEAATEQGGDEADKPSHASDIPGTQNQLEWDQEVPDVGFKITSPTDGQMLESGDEVKVEFDINKYRIGKTIGQHIHFIPDNQPYIAHYADGEALVLEDLEPGTHTIRAFPARHYHLSLKKGDVFETVTFHVEEKSEDFGFDAEEPYITYSRPKGTYSAEAGKELLLDFYVSNVELGDDAKVVYSVDGEKVGETTEWKPMLLPPMEPGEHDVNLKLVDGDGELIENGGYNNTTRTITVKEG